MWVMAGIGDGWGGSWLQAVMDGVGDGWNGSCLEWVMIVGCDVCSW